MKEAAAKLRTTLKDAVAAADRGEHITLTDRSVHAVLLPAGLDFTVRASRTGVNVTIEDRDGENSYVDRVTGGNRQLWSKQHQTLVIERVEALERFMFGRTLGSVKFGLVVTSWNSRARRGLPVHRDPASAPYLG